MMMEPAIRVESSGEILQYEKHDNSSSWQGGYTSTYDIAEDVSSPGTCGGPRAKYLGLLE